MGTLDVDHQLSHIAEQRHVLGDAQIAQCRHKTCDQRPEHCTDNLSLGRRGRAAAKVRCIAAARLTKSAWRLVLLLVMVVTLVRRMFVVIVVGQCRRCGGGRGCRCGGIGIRCRYVRMMDVLLRRRCVVLVMLVLVLVLEMF